MKDEELQELSEVIQSSNINFLFGAGVSTPFLPILGNIEKALNDAKDNTEKEKHYKAYIKNVMLPNKLVIKKKVGSNVAYKLTSSSYEEFFLKLTEIVTRRKSTLLSKQVNVFTTNIDILIEMILDKIKLLYNDGFTGRFRPIFGLSNFRRTTFQRSQHFDNISEIPTYNIIKMHGSLSWIKSHSGDQVIFSKTLSHLSDDLSTKTGAEFIKKYKSILVVNPEESKHLESVLNVYYYELLRMYSSELEKENALLFILGFSMNDKHIQEITVRAAKSNPTLRIFMCCSKKEKATMNTRLDTKNLPNIKVIIPEDTTEFFTLEYFRTNILEKINF